MALLIKNDCYLLVEIFFNTLSYSIILFCDILHDKNALFASTALCSKIDFIQLIKLLNILVTINMHITFNTIFITIYCILVHCKIANEQSVSYFFILRNNLMH